MTFDCHDPAALSRFWRDALGYVHPGPPGVEVPDGADPLDAWHELRHPQWPELSLADVWQQEHLPLAPVLR